LHLLNFLCKFNKLSADNCFRREAVIDQELHLRFDVEEGLEWIRKHEEIRDVLLTGGDPFIELKYI
jgi:L-lysine 2,3-aminomutase